MKFEFEFPVPPNGITLAIEGNSICLLNESMFDVEVQLGSEGGSKVPSAAIRADDEDYMPEYFEVEKFNEDEILIIKIFSKQKQGMIDMSIVVYLNTMQTIEWRIWSGDANDDRSTKE